MGLSSPSGAGALLACRRHAWTGTQRAVMDMVSWALGEKEEKECITVDILGEFLQWNGDGTQGPRGWRRKRTN